jgi:hypothetical protein
MWYDLDMDITTQELRELMLGAASPAPLPDNVPLFLLYRRHEGFGAVAFLGVYRTRAKADDAQQKLDSHEKPITFIETVWMRG